MLDRQMKGWQMVLGTVPERAEKKESHSSPRIEVPAGAFASRLRHARAKISSQAVQEVTMPQGDFARQDFRVPVLKVGGAISSRADCLRTFMPQRHSFLSED